MRAPQIIIRRLLLTEKGTGLTERHNQYLFEVDRAANKREIRDAVQKLFKVTVLKVNTMNRQGKQKRQRSMQYGRTAAWKRAVVALKTGDKIDLT